MRPKIRFQWHGRGIAPTLLFLFLLFFGGRQDFAADAVGADQANQAFLNVRSSRSENGPTPSFLSDYDMPGPSGVPLGGIGVGCVEFNPLGQFFRNGLNCVHDDYIIRDVPGSFFALWESSDSQKDGNAVRLVRDPAVRYGMRGFDHSVYRGLFPTARVHFLNEGAEPTVRASIYAYSGLVPHDVKDSSLPVIWFEIKLQNPGAATGASVAFSWQDIIGREIYDVAADQPLPPPGGYDNKKFGGPMARVPTFVEPYQLNAWTGLRVSTPQPFQPHMPTYQNYVQELGILTERSPDVTVSVLPFWNQANADQAWQSFRSRGEFSSTFSKSPLYEPGQPQEASTALAVKTSLRAGETKTIRFGLVWYFPELKSSLTQYGTADYGRYFQNFFGTMDDLFRYAVANREQMLQGTTAWQKPLLESTYPEWLQFLIINSAYEIYTNSTLNKAGLFSENEGGMGGLDGTVGCRAFSRNYHQRFFPELDRNDQIRSALTQLPSGAILHFTGNYYGSIDDMQGYSAVPQGSYLDDTPGWITLIDTEYRQSGDKAWLQRNLPYIKKGLAYLQRSYIPGTHLPSGPAAYDDFPNPKIYSYQISIYLNMLTDVEDMAKALDDPELLTFCRTETPLVRADFIKYLWNGRFFAQGCDPDGGNRQDFCMFGGQLAGEYMNRLENRGDIVPFEMTQASIISQFKTSITHSPEHYPDKRFDLEAMRGMDLPGSRAWPFYLETYTGLLGVEAGFYQDGLELTKDVLEVNLDRGFAWTQNLWRPGELTRIDSPVAWNASDILAGFGVDVAARTLYLAPVAPPGPHTQFKLPVYTQKFWGMVGIDTQKKYLALRVLKTFGDPMTVQTIISQPIGLPASSGKTSSIPPVALQEGLIIDLSSHYDEIMGCMFYPSIMSDPAATPWKTVENPYEKGSNNSSLNDVLRTWDKDYKSAPKLLPNLIRRGPSQPSEPPLHQRFWKPLCAASEMFLSSDPKMNQGESFPSDRPG